jgi:pimeloyl-ACP methyl ester carboxylesterase
MQKNRLTVLTVLLITGLITTTIPLLAPTFAATDSWTLVNDARAMKAYPDLKEYVWQRNASMAPNGQYDKIGLHRLVKTGITPKGVVFMLPGAYASGERLVSNPPTDTFTKTEDSQCIYWANRDFDVYTIDFRSHFIPADFNKSQLSFVADWGMNQYISDIKEAIDKAKEISGSTKLFLAGGSWGGIIAQIYAAKYWQQDLRGLILLDPGPMKSTVTKNQNLTNSFNLTAVAIVYNQLKAWSWENPQLSATPSPFNPGYVSFMQFAVQNPGIPAQYSNGTLITTINPRTNRTWANVTEYFEYQWNIAKATNTYGGYNNVTLIMNAVAQNDRYMPTKLFLDYACMLDYAECPYLPFDYTAHIKDINVPVIAFRSGLNLASYGNITNGIATMDFTWSVLPNYGHLDVFGGTYTARDVNEPALQWMRSQLVGLKATAFCNVTLISGGTWYFFAHSNGGVGSHSYQWYEGSTLLQGQTSMVLPVTKSALGAYNFYCKVTDSEGTTTNSNTVTLTVLG